MCFSESWLTKSMDDSFVDITSFTVVNTDGVVRTSGRSKGGRVILYVIRIAGVV